MTTDETLLCEDSPRNESVTALPAQPRVDMLDVLRAIDAAVVAGELHRIRALVAAAVAHFDASATTSGDASATTSDDAQSVAAARLHVDWAMGSKMSLAGPMTEDDVAAGRASVQAWLRYTEPAYASGDADERRVIAVRMRRLSAVLANVRTDDHVKGKTDLRLLAIDRAITRVQSLVRVGLSDDDWQSHVLAAVIGYVARVAPEHAAAIKASGYALRAIASVQAGDLRDAVWAFDNALGQHRDDTSDARKDAWRTYDRWRAKRRARSG